MQSIIVWATSPATVHMSMTAAMVIEVLMRLVAAPPHKF
jgi:hypothetical protein